MKKNLMFSRYSFLLVFLFLGIIITTSAQTRPVRSVDRTKVNPAVTTIEKPNTSQTTEPMESIPHFKNIVPENPGSTNENINRSNLKPVGVMPSRKFNTIPSSVNGTMTARHPYLNDGAYIEVLSGTSFTGKDKVDCACGTTQITRVRLFLQVTAGKDYLITSKVSTNYGRPFKLNFTTVEFSHQAEIRNNNQEVKLIITPKESGGILLYLLCNDLEKTNKPWIFHSISVKEVN